MHLAEPLSYLLPAGTWLGSRRRHRVAGEKPLRTGRRSEVLHVLFLSADQDVHTSRPVIRPFPLHVLCKKAEFSERGAIRPQVIERPIWRMHGLGPHVCGLPDHTLAIGFSSWSAVGSSRSHD